MALRLRPVIGLSRYLIALAFVAAGTLRVLAGEPIVNVDSDESLGAAHVRASIDIAAPPLIVWGVLTDCARAPHIIPNLESCQIVKHDPAGHWDIREHIINWAALMPRMRTVVRTSYEVGRRMQYKRVDGDMRVSQGEWRLDPAGQRACRAAVLQRPGGAELSRCRNSWSSAPIHEDLPDLLRAIERASLEDAAKH